MYERFKKQFKEYYKRRVFSENAPIGGDYIVVEGFVCPAGTGFIAALCAAKDINFTGKITIDLNRYDWGEDRDIPPVYVYFRQGKPVIEVRSVGNCYRAHGMEHIPRCRWEYY